MVHSKSWLSPLPDENYEVRKLLEEHDKRVRRNEYNPSSGLLPSLPAPALGQKQAPGLGNGLADFVSNASIGQYEGVVQLLKTMPAFRGSFQPFCQVSQDGSGFAYRFGVALADESTYVTALVQNGPGCSIFGMPASTAVGMSSRKRDEVIDPEVPWMARLQSVEANGGRFFVLIDLSEVE
jgi:hypothetical protein